MDSYQNWIGHGTSSPTCHGVGNNIQDFLFPSFSSISLAGDICRFIIHARDMKDETKVKGVYAYKGILLLAVSVVQSNITIFKLYLLWLDINFKSFEVP
uniref:Uncharacterized protein n=1 Tax=Triticum urartu TaxID=4572 RepID=A0A8R7UDI7_TRIUA